MSWSTTMFGFMVLYALLALIIGPYIQRKGDARTEAVLRNYREYCKQRDKEYPDMVGKWGKP